MGLIGYTARRLVMIIPTLLGASLIMFVLTMLIPGDPALLRLGNFATTEQLQQMREEMGLTKPPHQRYHLLSLGFGARRFGALMAHGQSGVGRSPGAPAHECGIGSL